MFYTDNEIQKILYKYETNKEYRRIYYKEKYNNDLEFRKKKTSISTSVLSRQKK